MSNHDRGWVLILGSSSGFGAACSKALAEAHLRASLEYNPRSTASHLFLAELLIDEGRVADARAELQQVLDAPLDPEWAPEDREFKDKAQALLGRTAGR